MIAHYSSLCPRKIKRPLMRPLNFPGGDTGIGCADLGQSPDGDRRYSAFALRFEPFLRVLRPVSGKN